MYDCYKNKFKYFKYFKYRKFVIFNEYKKFIR
jgi:hypothetical protein